MKTTRIKKALVIMLSIAVMLAFAGCGGNGEKKEKEKAKKATDIRATLILAMDNVNSDAAGDKAKEVEDLIAEYKEKVEVSKTDKEAKTVYAEFTEQLSKISNEVEVKDVKEVEKEAKEVAKNERGKKSASSNSSTKKNDKDNGKTSGNTTSKPNSSNSSGSSESKKPSSSSSENKKPSVDSSDKPAKPSEPERVWVVDVPGHYEDEPIYDGGYQGYWIKDAKGVVFFKTKDPEEFTKKKWELRNSGNNNWTSGNNLPSEIVGYKKVWVEEQGHWEYR